MKDNRLYKKIILNLKKICKIYINFKFINLYKICIIYNSKKKEFL